MLHFDELLRFIREHIVGLILTAVSLITVSLVKYAREQLRMALNWILAPLTNWLPWNLPIQRGTPNSQQSLRSDYSLVEVYIFDTSGCDALYQKTSSYEVMAEEIDSYREGVSAEGSATFFSTMRGTVLATESEHGFYVSNIALGATLKRGTHFTNVYAARLRNCFKGNAEHWTQEFAFSTRRATIQVHFPYERPPLSLSCKTIQGTSEVETKNAAAVLQLFGRPSAVWEIDSPSLNEIVKLEWIW